MPFNFDEGKPGDSDIVSQFPANERAARAAMRGAYVAEHSINTGRHHIGTYGTAAARDAAGGWEDGAIAAVAVSGGAALQLQRYTSSGWQPFQDIPPGTMMLFLASTAPLGWTQVTAWHDRLLRIINGGAISAAGDWQITGLSVENNQHFHAFSGVTGGPSSSVQVQGASALGVATNAHNHSFSGITTTENAPHVHVGDGSWRPAYLDVISCSKNGPA